MKREIKFRAWDKRANAFTDGWVIYPDGNCEYPQGGWDLGGYFENKEEFILMQYTGLKDKNGVEIYEGDILAFERTKDFKKETVHPFEVTWDNEKASWINFSPKDMVVVIGNIHENPELL